MHSQMCAKVGGQELANEHARRRGHLVSVLRASLTSNSICEQCSAIHHCTICHCIVLHIAIMYVAVQSCTKMLSRTKPMYAAIKVA